MYSSEFAYYSPTSLAEALSLLQRTEAGDVKVIAGGQSLLPLIKLRLASPTTLVDLAKVSDLKGIADAGDSVVIGAMTTYFQAIDSPVVQRRCPLLIQTIRQVGDPQIRARGTIGGSLAHADPAGDLPAAALALEAEIRAVGPGGQRLYDVRTFFQGALETALQPNEVLSAVRFTATDRPRTGTAYVKHAHPASGYAVVGIAAVVTLNEDGTCQSARIGITGAGDHATRASGVEQAIAGRPLDDASLAQVSASAADGLDLLSDTYASADYRAHLTRVLTRRALAQAADAARKV
jgi:carbon-monoxide dehydrogenase medium subunit